MNNKFKLRHVKYSPNNAKLTATFTDSKEASNGTFVNLDHQVTSDAPPHPDFLKTLEELKPMLAQASGLTRVISAMKKLQGSESKVALEVLAGDLEQIEQEILADLTVTGISLSGQEDNEGVIITGVYDNGSAKLAKNSPRITFNRDIYGFEEDLQELCDTLVEETRKYATEGKSAQLSLDLTESAPGEDHDSAEEEAEELPTKEEKKTTKSSSKKKTENAAPNKVLKVA
jgi:hypothetical protein